MMPHRSFYMGNVLVEILRTVLRFTGGSNCKRLRRYSSSLDYWWSPVDMGWEILCPAVEMKRPLKCIGQSRWFLTSTSTGACHTGEIKSISKPPYLAINVLSRHFEIKSQFLLIYNYVYLQIIMTHHEWPRMKDIIKDKTMKNRCMLYACTSCRDDHVDTTMTRLSLRFILYESIIITNRLMSGTLMPSR